MLAYQKFSALKVLDVAHPEVCRLAHHHSNGGAIYFVPLNRKASRWTEGYSNIQNCGVSSTFKIYYAMNAQQAVQKLATLFPGADGEYIRKGFRVFLKEVVLLITNRKHSLNNETVLPQG